MLKITSINPQPSLSKELIRLRPNEADFNRFKELLNTLLHNIDEADRENRQEIYVLNFLRGAFYGDDYEINKKNDIDLAIHLGKTKDDKVGVIIEAKRPSNTGEMISVAKPNVKALQQAILYFMRERVDENNIDLRYIVVTNIKEWFIFSAADFNRHFYDNAKFRKDYEEWRDKIKSVQKTKDFYTEIAKPALDNLSEPLECTHFNLKSYESADEKELIVLYKILSPFYLLKRPTENDSNALDRNFYAELLHIIGLEETKVKSKTLIDRKPEGKRDAGSLIEKAIAKVADEYSIFPQQDKLLEFGANFEERVYNISLELCIVWVNRILFLKLLESQLVNYHEGDRSYRFLDIAKVNDFTELRTLFHDVLNKNIAEREAIVSSKYAFVPYLNSSLFDFSDTEKLTIRINALDNNINLTLSGSSILKKIGETANSLPTLEYLFRFLDAYDFASEGKEGLQKENRSLINASVLGKVFEKINGYKDGSFYTPGFITMYMCRQAIRLAVVQKFRDTYKLDIETFDDLYIFVSKVNKAEKLREYSELINTLKICDPAVGSGHFLVSALNEILAIKSELGLFAAYGKPFNQYSIVVANDELLIIDRAKEPFRYIVRNGKPLNEDMQRLQEIIFHEKQTLIENCLFGVDINPNSVKICRLRLWIELLKNAFYKSETDYRELETLPNIDINIQKGNSLISRFALDASLKDALKLVKYSVEDYRNNVNRYKNERNREIKRELLEVIERIKADFRVEIFKTHPKMRELGKKERRLFEINSPQLFDKYSEGEREALSYRLESEIEIIKNEIEEIKSNRIFRNAFEWRFEFPEVLSNDGDFLGFDVIIGNPPYVESRSSAIEEELKDKVLELIKNRRGNDDAKLITRGADLLVYFFEIGLNIIKETGYFSFVTQNAWLDTDYGLKFQKFLKRNTQILGVFDSNVKYFDESANINTILTLFRGNKPNNNSDIVFAKFASGFDEAPFELNKIEQLNLENQINKFKTDDTTLNQLKWGIILNSDDLIINIHKRLFEAEEDNQPSFKIGQGFNLTKEFVVTPQTIDDLNIGRSNLISFFTNDDGAVFTINNTENCLVNSDELTDEQLEVLKAHKIQTISLENLKRNVPNLVLPRGIGRYFCATNPLNSYTSSFVEIYLENNDDYERNLLFLWTFLNSSLGWLIREVSGRKNLGGGMLKAEATDLKNYPIFFNFSNEMPTIKKIYQSLTKRKPEKSIVEIYSKEHIAIDEVVFNKLNFHQKERIETVAKLFDLISYRENKAKGKI